MKDVISHEQISECVNHHPDPIGADDVPSWRIG